MDMTRRSAKYFFDRHTDGLSFDLGDASQCIHSESLFPGVTLHVDERGVPLVLEIQGASKIVDTIGLSSHQTVTMPWDEVAQRMSATADGERIWQDIVGRVLVQA
jgi:hypothetical protein